MYVVACTPSHGAMHLSNKRAWKQPLQASKPTFDFADEGIVVGMRFQRVDETSHTLCRQAGKRTNNHLDGGGPQDQLINAASAPAPGSCLGCLTLLTLRHFDLFFGPQIRWPALLQSISLPNSLPSLFSSFSLSSPPSSLNCASLFFFLSRLFGVLAPGSITTHTRTHALFSLTTHILHLSLHQPHLHPTTVA